MYRAIKHGLQDDIINEVGQVQKDVALYGLYRADINSMASSTVSDEIGILVRFLNYLEGQSIGLIQGDGNHIRPQISCRRRPDEQLS